MNQEQEITFMSAEAANELRKSHRRELDLLAQKYQMSVEDLVRAASNDLIPDDDDLFLIFKRSYVLLEQ